MKLVYLRSLAAGLLWLAAGLFSFLHAQTPTIQDCLGAIPVCQDTYVEEQSPSGTGNIPNELLAGQSCTDGEINSIWYIFTANDDGMLGFIITPNNLNDDYDWALFNITNADCDDIGEIDNLLVSCNAAGGGGCHGATGCTASGTGNWTPGGCSSGTPFNALVPMSAGETFVLMVSNWTGSTNGYTLDFSESTGLGVFDQTHPEVESIDLQPNSCGDDEMLVTFNEFLQCSTVSNTALILQGPGGPYSVDISSPECSQGSNQSRHFLMSISPPIASMGDFTLTIDPSINTEYLDLCGNSVLPFVYNFTVDTPIPIMASIGPDTSLVCEGDELILDASAAGLEFLWEDGSTDLIRTVTSAGIYAVTVTDECGIGEDQVEVYVQIEPPSVELGDDVLLCTGETLLLDADNGIAFYEWQNGSSAPTFNVTSTGDYAVTVTNGCGTVEDALNVTYVPDLQLSLAGQYVLCQGDTLTIDLESPFATYQWADGSDAGLRQFTDGGDHAVTVTTPCETFSADFSALFLIDPKLDLGPDTLLCPGDTLFLDPAIPGDYLWQDGSNQPTLTVTGPGLYTLEIATVCNVLTGDIDVTYMLPIDTELGRDTFLCPGTPFLLDAGTEAPVTYLWDNGEISDRRVVFDPGLYTVTVTSDCQTVLDTIDIVPCEICQVYVPNIFSPNDDGINDKVQPLSDCLLEDYQFAVYDRWGAQVFLSQNPGQGWNGKLGSQPAPQGAYVWVVEYTVTENGHPRRARDTGEVVVIR